MSNLGLDWQAYLRPRAAVVAALLALLLGSFGFSVYQGSLTLQESMLAQSHLSQAARSAQDAQRLEFLASDLNGWLSSYALDVSLGGNTDAAQNVYAQSYGATLSEFTALLGEFRRSAVLDEQGQKLLENLAANLTQLNLIDGQVRDAYARGTPGGIREGTALVRGEAFTTYQSLSSSASALARRVIEQAQIQAQRAEALASVGRRRMVYFTLGAAVLMLLLAGMVVEVIRKRERVVRQLRRLAERDGLTGVANRRRWDELLAYRAAQARRKGTALSVVLLDLDHFKAFNDTHGHQAGDDQLRAVAELLAASVGKRVTVARYGGEEFGLLFPGETPAQVQAQLDHLRAKVPNGQSFSAGVAQLLPDEAPEHTVKRTDVALYAAKRAGRAHTVLADQADLRVSSAAAMETD